MVRFYCARFSHIASRPSARNQQCLFVLLYDLQTCIWLVCYFSADFGRVILQWHPDSSDWCVRECMCVCVRVRACVCVCVCVCVYARIQLRAMPSSCGEYRKNFITHDIGQRKKNEKNILCLKPILRMQEITTYLVPDSSVASRMATQCSFCIRQFTVHWWRLLVGIEDNGRQLFNLPTL